MSLDWRDLETLTECLRDIESVLIEIRDRLPPKFKVVSIDCVCGRHIEINSDAKEQK